MSVLKKHGIEPHPGLPRGYLSFSQISKYLRCAKQYEFHYIQQAQYGGSEALALGKAVHEAMEFAHEAQLKGEEVKLAELLNVARHAAHDQIEVHGWSPDCHEYLTGMKYGAESCTLAWWQNFGQDCEVISTEEEVVHIFEGPEGEPVPMLSYIDLRHRRNDGVEEILDYKTTGRAKSQAWTEENLQLWIYSIITGIRDVGILSIVRPKGNIKNYTSGCAAKVDIKRTRVSLEQQAHAKNIIKDVVKGIVAGVFPRCAPGEWNCTAKWCDHFDKCRGHLQFINPPPTLSS